MTVLELHEELTALLKQGLGDAQVWASYNYAVVQPASLQVHRLGDRAGVLLVLLEAGEACL